MCNFWAGLVWRLVPYVALLAIGAWAHRIALVLL